MNNHYKDNYYIAPSQIHGSGIFAKRFLQKNKVIGIVIYNYLYIFPTVTQEFGSWINHSYRPNSQLCKRGSYYYLVASRDIYPNQEITADYVNTPWFIRKPESHYK